MAGLCLCGDGQRVFVRFLCSLKYLPGREKTQFWDLMYKAFDLTALSQTLPTCCILETKIARALVEAKETFTEFPVEGIQRW